MLLDALRTRQTTTWPRIDTFSDALAEAIQYPAYFLTASGFELNEAAAVSIATQASSVLEEILSAEYPTTVGIKNNRWREAVLAFRLLCAFVHSLIGYLEAIETGEGQLAILRSRVFAVLPISYNYFVWATLKLMCKVSAKLRQRGVKNESDGILEYIAIVLGPECGDLFEIGVSKKQLEEWARMNPSMKFERPSVNTASALSPGKAIEKLRLLLKPYEQAKEIPSIGEFAATKRKMNVVPQYRQFVEQSFLSQAIIL
jgi:hypothetical protein